MSTVEQLQGAVSTANGRGGNTSIVLADGVYTLTGTLYVNAPNIVIRSGSGRRERVTVQGDAMSANARVGNLIRVAASGFQLRGVTLQRSGYHLIQVAGETNADAPVIRDCVLRDAYQQMLKVTRDPANPSVVSDGGLVENCVFEYTAGIGPQYYIGGIDAHGARNWTVRNNTFRNIASPSTAVAEFAIHFHHTNNGAPYADVAIALTESPGSAVYNNTVLLENGFPWTVEYRFGATSGVQIVNNLVNRPIVARDGASGTVTSNVTSATRATFRLQSAGDLHLSGATSGIVDAGVAVSGLTGLSEILCARRVSRA